MRTLEYLAAAATVALTVFAAPTKVAMAMECYDLCFNFYPPQSLMSRNSDERDLCDKRVRESGGSCTIHGRLNVTQERPRGIGYRLEDYADPRYYYWDHYNFWPDPSDVPPNVRQRRP